MKKQPSFIQTYEYYINLTKLVVHVLQNVFECETMINNNNNNNNKIIK